MATLTSLLRHTAAGLRILLAMTVILGIGYPLAVFGAGQMFFPHEANGSMVSAQGRTVGSSLIGQVFEGENWFHSRPSASDYDALASGGTAMGPESPELLAAVQERRAAVAAREHVPPAAVPPDALTASASALDPHISPTYARLQADRVATARGLDPAVVSALVEAHVQDRMLGFLGEPRVNVLELNLALDTLGRPAATEEGE